MSSQRKITKEELRGYICNFVTFLDEKIESFDDLNNLNRMLTKKPNEKFYLFDDSEGEHNVEVSIRPSEMNTKAFTVSYVTPKKGIPIEFKINDQLKYSMIIAKGDFSIDGYSPFGANVKDIYGNIPQYKRLDSIDVKDINSELNALEKSLL